MSRCQHRTYLDHRCPEPCAPGMAMCYEHAGRNALIAALREHEAALAAAERRGAEGRIPPLAKALSHLAQEVSGIAAALEFTGYAPKEAATALRETARKARAVANIPDPGPCSFAGDPAAKQEAT